MQIIDLSFADLFIGGTPSSCWMKSSTDSLIRNRIPQELFNELAAFREALLAAHKDHQGQPFYFKWGQETTRSFRVTPIETVHNKPLFVCRSHLAKARSLQELNWPPQICDYLFRQPVKEGLFLFMGSMGAGKTTSASSFVMQHVSKFGGVAMTIEYPKEMDIEGEWGNGSIYQTEIPSEAMLGETLRGMLGSSANILYPSEIKSSDSAHEVVNLSLTGHPIVSTLHAPNLADGLLRFSRLLNGQNDGLAGALKAAFHIQLIPGDRPGVKPDSGSPALVSDLKPFKTIIRPLLILPETKDAICSNIRSGNFGFLNNEIDRQGRLFMGGRL